MKHIQSKASALIATAILTVLMFLAFGSPKDETIIWARNLKVEEVAKIEAIQMPSAENERYKNYDLSEFAGIVEIINDARGKQIDNPEQLYGGALTFYITMKYGTRHTFSNIGNAYLVIDDVHFDAGYYWLESWGNKALNDKIPDDFEY